MKTTNYFTRWVEVVPLRQCNKNPVISFLECQIVIRFGATEYLIFDDASYFTSIDLTPYALKKGIKLNFYSNYYPQGNGLAEYSNKSLIEFLNKTMASHHKDWHTQLYNALWPDWITPKVAIGNYPYHLVYGKEDILPSNITIPSLKIAQYIQEDDSSSLQ